VWWCQTAAAAATHHIHPALLRDLAPTSFTQHPCAKLALVLPLCQHTYQTLLHKRTVHNGQIGLLLLLQLTTYIQRSTAADCTTWQ
jgi:hypothetical protein